MDKLLSIIIPSYNMEAFLSRCLDTLIVSPERMAWLDVMIVNDGSTDSTSAIGHEYADKYPGIFRVIDKQNGHYGSCINAALQVALGKYIRILDADDYFDNEAFCHYLDALNGVDVDVVVSDYNQVDSQGNVVSSIVYNHIKPNEVMPILQVNVGVLMMHGLAYRTEFLRGIHYKQTEGILYTDSEWSYIPMLDAETICYFHLNVYQYLVDREGQSMSKAMQQKMMSHRVKVLRSMLAAYLGDHPNSNNVNARYTLRNYFVNIYMLVIVKGADNLENQRMIRDLDEDLKSLCIDMYQYIGEYSIHIFGTKYKVIDRWRNHKLMNTRLLHQLVRLDNVYLSYRFRIQKLLKRK